MLLDDETLIAFVDGELDEKQTKQVEVLFEQQPELQVRIERIMAADQKLCQGFNVLLKEPPPKHLIDAIHNSPIGASSSQVVDLPVVREKSSLTFWYYGIAASVMLLVGVVVGLQIQPSDIDSHTLAQADSGLLLDNNPLYRALQQTPSQQSYQITEEDRVTPIMSFIATDGRYCREFEVASKQTVSLGVACREDHVWRVELLLASQDQPLMSSGYQPASGFNQQALDAVLDPLWSGEAFGADDEQRLIDQQWQDLSKP